MKRIILDVPRWHVFLHRDARGKEMATSKDSPIVKFEDELFDRLYAGETERLPERQQDPKLRGWAESAHAACETLPAFGRLSAECRGDAYAAGVAVETLIDELKPHLPQASDEKPPDTIVRRALGSACEKASQAIEEVRDGIEGPAFSPERRRLTGERFRRVRSARWQRS